MSNSEFTLTYDHSKSDNIPYFSQYDNPKEYFTTKKTPLCRASGCTEYATHPCKTSSCYNSNIYFCENHADHTHYKCRDKYCKSPAVSWSISENVECCAHHYKEWYVGCKEYGCETPLDKSNKIIGFCNNHNAMWNHLKNKGVAGPFGSGKSCFDT